MKITHKHMHEMLDQLIACYFAQTGKLFSRTKISDLMKWSCTMMDRERAGEKLPCTGKAPHDRRKTKAASR